MSVPTSILLFARAAAIALVFLSLSAAPPALAGEDGLVLRVEDAEARPGGRLAVVLRTYEPRPLGQGQVCMRMRALRRGPQAGPLLALEEVRVFGAAGDVSWSESFAAATQTAIVEFTTLAATVNATDGPIAVLFFRVAADPPIGEPYQFEVDLGETELFDPDGAPVAVVPRAGDVTFLAPGAPVTLEVEGGVAAAGSVFATGVSSAESLPLAAGEVALWYDPALLGGTPTAVVDPRYGAADLTLDTTTAGLLRVAFQSPDHSLNEVPGTFLSIFMPLAVDAPLGLSALTLDPASTYLQAPSGAPLSLELENDTLEVLSTAVFFVDGFESGDPGAWSLIVAP